MFVTIYQQIFHFSHHLSPFFLREKDEGGKSCETSLPENNRHLYEDRPIYGHVALAKLKIQFCLLFFFSFKRVKTIGSVI